LFFFCFFFFLLFFQVLLSLLLLSVAAAAVAGATAIGQKRLSNLVLFSYITRVFRRCNFVNLVKIFEKSSPVFV
jgi:hypothetical protein